MKLCSFAIVFAFALCESARSANLETSPCPRLFVYERNSLYHDRWYGIVTVLSDSNLNGIWLRIMFDRPIIQLGNWFGEVVKKSATEYLIKNPNYNLKGHTPKIVRFFVRYNVNDPPPQLIGFRLNAKTICPEEVVSTTPTTTTEHLFTNSEENFPPIEIANKNNFIATEDSTTTERPLFISQLKPTEPTPESCGRTLMQSINPQKQVAQIGQFPWHAALYYTKEVSIAYLCGATLISKEHLITVAHCVVKGSTRTVISPDRLVAYLGKYYLKNWLQQGTQTRYVSKITPHPAYKGDVNANDIAIIKLTNVIEVTNLVRPVCLWKDEVNTNVGSVVGWGFDEKGHIKEKLMYVDMAIQTNEICNASVENFSIKFNNDLTYCASFLNDTIDCVGDSGGGMVFRSDDGFWQLRGVVTISVVLQRQLKCGPQQYVVFTDVSKYENWINEELKS